MNSDWRSYPFRLVPGDPQLDFPAAEGEHPDQESDTWFIAGQLDATESGRSFAFLTIFNKNRPGGTIVYSTCTISPPENEQVVDAILAAHPELRPDDLQSDAPLWKHPSVPHHLLLLPHRDGTDGFFIARLRRAA